jgi:hypothetical protein
MRTPLMTLIWKRFSQSSSFSVREGFGNGGPEVVDENVGVGGLADEGRDAFGRRQIRGDPLDLCIRYRRAHLAQRRRDPPRPCH